MRKWQATATINIHPLREVASISLFGERGGHVSYIEVDRKELRRIAVRAVASADYLDAAVRGESQIRCVCTSDVHIDGRCTGRGQVEANHGYCAGCRSPEYGTVDPNLSHTPSKEVLRG